MRLLVGKGVDITAGDDHAETAKYWAALGDNESVVRLTLRRRITTGGQCFSGMHTKHNIQI